MSDEQEKAIARKILEKNPKLRDAGLDTMGIVERTKTARKGAKVGLGEGATSLDELRDAFENQLAEISAKIAMLEQQRLALKQATHDKVSAWVATQKDPAPVLALRKAFLDKIGYKKS